MRRREFIGFVGGAAMVWPLAARAQQPVVGFLSSASPGPYARFVAGFRRGLNEAGFVEDRNVAIVYRWAEGQYDRLPALATDLVARNVSAIVASGGLPSSLAAKAATATIPIVFTLGSDPVKFGLVASLNRPGVNITGMTLFSYLLDPNRLALLHELAPSAGVIALLCNPSNPQPETQSVDAEAAARGVRQQLIVLNANSVSDF